MTPEQAIEAIHGFIRKGAAPGLHRIRELLSRAGNPERALKFVHIAGTNGKGSTAAMTASILTAAGYRTGLFTSPFVFRFEERMQIDGVQISGPDLAAVTEAILPHARAMAEPPTEFELVCAIAFAYFRRKGCDIVVLEAGMGGLVDATNAIGPPEVAVITNIGLDHTEFLGDTPEKIAANKAGIFKAGSSAVVYRGAPEVEAVFEAACARLAIPLKKADFAGLRPVSHTLEGQRFDCGSRKDLFLPLLGAHQLRNGAVALAVADALTERGWCIPEEAIRRGLATVGWPGRFEVAARDPLFIIDGGHNPQCIAALETNIREYLAGRRIIGLTGVLADKDYVDMYRGILPLVEKFVCITPPSPRKLEGTVLAEHLRRAGADAVGCGSIPQAVRLARELAGPEGAVVCFGSLYSIAAIREALDSLHP